ncbi:hypothetical protein [Montanilutibacter psychrotolerans]|uniref:DUF4124 domain-containing protein n=1 Tax=Montanilutibacter psychrotolerans TaxID=1327343 RepID=A0A3M8SXD5_9GAMM|nr:hypothetical protein [Lysobacter psychrotolerans]RNF85957.1 hypothetical protein EER27_00505 [Lysobacter psychrotolerans]
MPRKRPTLFLPLACLLAAAGWLPPGDATAQVRRCVGADGSVVFTDRRCADVGGVERRPHTGSTLSAKRAYRGGCARNLNDLVHEVTSAIDARDGTRLAGVYHWAGMSGRTAYTILERLNTIANRPLVDIAPVYPRPPMEYNEDGTPYPYPSTTVRRTPVALRLEQTIGNTGTPSRTVFGLQRHFGCWWIRGG